MMAITAHSDVHQNQKIKNMVISITRSADGLHCMIDRFNKTSLVQFL